MRNSKIISGLALALVLANTPLALAAQAGASPAARPAAKPAARPAAKPAAGAQTSAKKLLDNARMAVASIYKVAKASGGKLDPKKKKQAPFWQAVKEMNGTLVEIGKQVKAKDKRLAATMSKGSETLSKLKTVWPRIGVTDAKVSGLITKLDNAYTALRSSRGAEGARARKGGELSAQEKERFQKIQQSQGQFSQKLGAMKAKAQKNKDRGSEANLARLIEQSNRIAKAQLTVDAFLLALLLIDQLQGEWDAYSYYVGPSYRDEWVEVNVWVETSFTSYDTWYVESFEVYSAEAYGSWETSFEVDVDFEYEISDVSLTEVDTLTTEFDASFEYEELSWESYSEELVTADMEDTVYDEAEDNLDVAAESWEEEGLEVEAGEELMDEEDAEEFDDEEGEDDEDLGDDEEGEDDEDLGDDEEGEDDEDLGDDEESEDDEDLEDDEEGEDDEDLGDDEDDAGDDEEYEDEGEDEDDAGEEDEEEYEDEGEEDGGEEEDDGGGEEEEEEPPFAALS